MKLIKLIILSVVILAFAACTDRPFAPWMDLTPPRGGWLWVAKNSNSSAIYKVDVSTGKWIDILPVLFKKDRDGSIMGLAFGDGKLWVGLDEAGDEFDPGGEYYCWIDPVTGEMGDWVELEDGIHPKGLAWDDSNLWIAGGLYYALFDPYSGELIRKQTLHYNRIYGLACDGSRLWLPACEYVDFEPIWFIYELDPDTGDINSRIPSPCEGTTGLSWDGEALWVNDAKNAVVYRVAPDTGTVLGYFAYDFAPGPWGLAWEFPSE